VKVAFVIPTLGGGGAECVVSRLSLHLARTRPVVVITWDGRDPAYAFGGEIIDLKLPASKALLGKPWQQRQRHKALVEVLAAHQVSHAIAFMESAGVILAMAKRRLLPHLHATVSIRNAPSHVPLVIRMWARTWYRHVDRVVVQTRDGLSQIGSHWKIPNDRCAIIANPIPDDWLLRAPEYSKRQAGLIVAVGRLEKQKDFPVLLNAVAALPAYIPWRLAILGEGSQREALRDLVEKLGIVNRVEMPGHVNDVKSWLDRARVFVLCSRHEGFPNALSEAMASGCPVISTDCPTGPGEMIEHGRSGWLIPVGDSAALANAMTEAFLDGRRAEQFGHFASQRAEQWAIERIAPQWIKDV
jgi:glycosyltransferase involved in cell wall biosynthesis